MRALALTLSIVALTGVAYLLGREAVAPADGPQPDADPRIEALEQEVATLRRMLEKDPRSTPTLLAQDEGQRILQQVDERIATLRKAQDALAAKFEALPPASTAPTPNTPAPGTATPAARKAPADPAVVARWIEALDHEDEDQVFTATIELARLGDLRATNGLIRITRTHKDFYARLGAATALGELQAVEAVPDLIEALADKDELVRSAANEAIHRITKKDFGFRGGASQEVRTDTQRKIGDWWRDNADAVAQRVREAR